jgi:hypothetical protein
MPAPPSSRIDPAVGHLVKLAAKSAEDRPSLLAVLARLADPRRRRAFPAEGTEGQARPELDAEIAAAAQDAGMSYSAWIAQTARKEFIIRAGLDAVGQYEAERGPFTPDEIAEADEWAARIIQPPATRRTA